MAKKHSQKPFSLEKHVSDVVRRRNEGKRCLLHGGKFTRNTVDQTPVCNMYCPEFFTSLKAKVKLLPKKKKIVIIEQIYPFTPKYQPTNIAQGDVIFLHYSAAGSLPGIAASVNTLYGGKYGGATAHFTVAQNGRIIQMVDLQHIAYCQGVADANTAQSKAEIVRNRGIDPNQYAYSIECISPTTAWGELSDIQIEAVVYNMRYIKEKGKGKIEFSRDWDDYPKLPKLKYKDGRIIEDKTLEKYIDFNNKPRSDRKTSDKTLDDLAETTGIDYDILYNAYHGVARFENVTGKLLGHNDVDGQTCPGVKFPWLSILNTANPLGKSEEIDFREWQRSLDDTVNENEEFYAEQLKSFMKEEKIDNEENYEVVNLASHLLANV